MMAKMNSRISSNGLCLRCCKLLFDTIFKTNLILISIVLVANSLFLTACLPKPQYQIFADQTHNKLSRNIVPVLRVPSGAIIEAYTEEASDRQLYLGANKEDLLTLDFNLVHPVTGPVYIEGAEPGDILAVTLHEIELGDWGWSAIVSGFGQLSGKIEGPYLRTFELGKTKKSIRFNDKISIPIKPFLGIMAVAPDIEEDRSTIPPYANGGNMDDPNITVGTTVYFPIFVSGALFSIGDAHALQGSGEVSGTAIEAPMRVVYEVNVIKGGRQIQEPQYENSETYAVTAYSTNLDQAAEKATGYMIDYLMQEHALSIHNAYMLCSLAGDLKIAEVVNVPNKLVTMHISKQVLGSR